MQLVKRIVRLAGAFFLPQACALCGCWVCGADWVPLCSNCQSGLQPLVPPTCKSCGDSIPGPGTLEQACLRCRETPPGFEIGRAWGAYRGDLRSLIRKFKYGGEPRLAGALAELLESAYYRNCLPRPDYLMGVPSHVRRVRERGFDPTGLLVRRLGRKLGVPICRVARRVRHTPPLFGLDEPTRRKNLSGAFEIKPDSGLEDRHILVVDDILTTGSTASELARALKQQAKVGRVSVLVVARTARHLQ